MNIEINHKLTGSIIVSGDYKSIKDCLLKNIDADLGDADLRDADLRGAYLRGAYLRGAYLRDADLRGATGYSQSHDIFKEAVRRQPVSAFVDAEWSAIAQITIHILCWDSIKKRFSDVMPHIFEVLAKAGFGDYLEYWNNLK